MQQGTVTVDATPTVICELTFDPAVVVQNTGDVAVFIGGESVAASGASAGLALAPGAILTIPFAGSAPLYGIVASDTDTGTLSFLVP